MPIACEQLELGPVAEPAGRVDAGPSAAVRAAGWLLDGARVPVVRTIRRFAEEEIVIPEGPHAGERFRCDTQPYAGLLLDEIDRRFWRRIAVVGPTQSGKSLVGYEIPIVYHLFEHGETTICGVPDMNMAADKWEMDLLPVIERTRYDRLRPRRGPGSRGGAVRNAVKFTNGATLKFMSGGGSDAKRSQYTARVAAVTEADKLDEPGGGSREGDKISQIEARTGSFADRARIYLECTASIERGRIWHEYQQGTASRIACPCPHCKAWVTPEREHLVGWQTAETLAQARKAARWCCPACAAVLTERQRRKMNERARLVHRGQRVTPKGRVLGPRPRTDTLGFRWNAFNNLFWTAADVAEREWKGARDPDEENAKKVLRQFVWALPYEPPTLRMAVLEAEQISRRTIDVPRGHVPAACAVLTVGIDLGQRECHWVAQGWTATASPHVLDYAAADVASNDLGVERALINTLHSLHELFEAGWPGADGQMHRPDLVWIDSGWKPDVVYTLVRELRDPRYCAVKGHGQMQTGRVYRAPRATSSTVVHISDGYHIVRLAGEGIFLFEVNSDHWKSWVHQRLATPVGEPGALTLYAVPPVQHLRYAKQLTSEEQISEFHAGLGEVIRWQNPGRRANHFLDATYMGAAAAHLAGVRLLEQPGGRPTAADDPPKRRTLTLPDGRPFLVTERQ